jgi:hypothetical protein
VEGTNKAVLGSSDQRKVRASLSLVLKSKNIPTLLYVGKGPKYKPFRDFRPVPFGLPASGTDFKPQKGLYSGPSSIPTDLGTDLKSERPFI